MLLETLSTRSFAGGGATILDPILESDVDLFEAGVMTLESWDSEQDDDRFQIVRALCELSRKIRFGVVGPIQLDGKLGSRIVSLMLRAVRAIEKCADDCEDVGAMKSNIQARAEIIGKMLQQSDLPSLVSAS